MTRHNGPAPGTAPGELPIPVTRILLDPVDERHVSRMWQRIAARRGSPRSDGIVALRWASLGIVLGTLLTLLATSATPRQPSLPASSPALQPGPLRLAGGSAIDVIEVAPAASPVAATLSDGSALHVAPGARVEPLASSGSQFVLRLARGRTSFDVVPGGPRRWLVEAGIATIEVVGTSFTVDRSPERVRVEVRRGVVLVRGDTLPDGVVRLVAGESVVVEPSRPEPPPEQVLEPEARPPRLHRDRDPKPIPWRAALAGGGYGDAYAVLGPDGLAGEAARSESADELFDLADVARLSGHPADAVLPLERLLSLHGHGPRAPVAALTLGRIELQLKNPHQAAGHLEHALRLGVPRGLEEDALVRLVQAYSESGQGDEARRVADDYARRFPEGRRAAEVQAWLRR